MYFSAISVNKMKDMANIATKEVRIRGDGRSSRYITASDVNVLKNGCFTTTDIVARLMITRHKQR